MAKTNTKKTVATEYTHEGAVASKINYEQELRRSVMSNLLWENEFYEDGVSISKRIAELIPKVSADKVAHIAIIARSVHNLRHVPLFIVREMARHNSHKHLVASTLEQVIQRADELSEFLAIYWKEGKTPISNQVKKGVAAAFTKFSEYNLAKYNRDSEIKLRDVLFLCHAKPKNETQAELWKKLVEDKLETPDTWEVELSKSTDKKSSWTRLIQEGKLGGLATLKNLRNIVEHTDIKLAKEAIAKADYSRVLPFRFISAARFAPNLESDLEKFMFRNVANYGKLNGKTLILVDVSGSMEGKVSDKSDISRLDAACGVAMIVREICDDVEVYSFSNNEVAVPNRHGFALRDAISRSQGHGGTDLRNSLNNIHKKTSYDRIIIITDEQSNSTCPDPLGKNSYIINVASYEHGLAYNKYVHINGFSEAVVQYICELEKFGE